MPAPLYEIPELADVPLARALSALADPCRVAILRKLLQANRELACHELELRQSKATVSHHMRTLREGGLVATRSEGTKCFSRVRREEFDARFPGLIDLVLAEAEVGSACC